MKKPFIPGWLMMVLVLAPHWGSPRAETELFRAFHVEAIGGVMFPAGNLSGAMELAPLAGLGLESSYYGPWKAHGRVQYSSIHAPNAVTGASLHPKPRRIHYAKAGTGMRYQTENLFLPSFGLGLSLYFIRSWSEDGNGEDQPALLLDDNESEFGAYPFLQWSMTPTGRVRIVARLEWDVIFSAPRFSHMPHAHLGLGWAWKSL